jgi:hypothetical protein
LDWYVAARDVDSEPSLLAVSSRPLLDHLTPKVHHILVTVTYPPPSVIVVVYSREGLSGRVIATPSIRFPASHSLFTSNDPAYIEIKG